MSKIRQQRAEEQIKIILSELCQREVRDPRLRDITITRTAIDREFQTADVYVNALGDETRQKEVMDALKRATGFLRKELAARTRFRTVPQLHFHWDPTLAHAEQVNQILDNLYIPPPEEEPEAEGEGGETPSD
jgi:ribosome-binding factor A